MVRTGSIKPEAPDTLTGSPQERSEDKKEKERRRPTKAEMDKTLAYVGRQKDRRQALEDVLWVILNSKEFMFNH